MHLIPELTEIAIFSKFLQTNSLIQALKIPLTYQNNNHSHTANCLTTKGIQRQQQIRTKRSRGRSKLS